MSKSGRDGLDPEIIISTLIHTNIPTLIVEGSGDEEIYRSMERMIGVGAVDILKCGGRKDLLEIFEKRQEFEGKPVVFLADLDDFIYFGVDIKYRDIIFTSGYSIENDVMIHPCVDYLFDEAERDIFDQTLRRMVEIYSEKISRRQKDPTENLEIHPFMYYDYNQKNFKSDGMFSEIDKNYEWYEHISNNARMLVRGKNLVSLYTAILSHPRRRSKFSSSNIIEMHLKSSESTDSLAEIINSIRKKFHEIGTAV